MISYGISNLSLSTMSYIVTDFAYRCFQEDHLIWQRTRRKLQTSEHMKILDPLSSLICTRNQSGRECSSTTLNVIPQQVVIKHKNKPYSYIRYKHYSKESLGTCPKIFLATPNSWNCHASFCCQLESIVLEFGLKVRQQPATKLKVSRISNLELHKTHDSLS